MRPKEPLREGKSVAPIVHRVAIAVLTLLLGGCGIGRAASLAILHAEVSPPDARMEAFHLNTVFIDTAPSVSAAFLSTRSAADLLAHYDRTLRAHGWKEHERTHHPAATETEARIYERFGIELTIIIWKQADIDEHGQAQGTRVSTDVSMEYPWDYYGCRTVQCLVWGLTGLQGHDAALFLIGLF